MLNETTIMLLQKKFEDEEFAKKIMKLESSREVVDTLKEENIEITEEEVVKIKDSVMKLLQSDCESDSDELTDDDLEEVSGGFFQLIKAAASAIFKVISFTNEVTNRRW